MSAPFISYDHRDEFEQFYLAKFHVLAARRGIAIVYVTDRGALDLGLHLTMRKNEKAKGVTSSRIWFQFKGQSEKTLSQQNFEVWETISQQVEVQHLRQWARYGEVVYLVVYVEAVDKFFAIDIQRLISERWGDTIYDDEPFLKKDGTPQGKVTVHIPKAETEVNDAYWEKLGKHQSIRIDLGSYQGAPLAHTHDLQSKILGMLEPELYAELIGQLLVAHDFRPSAIANNIALIYPNAEKSGDKVTLLLGKLFESFQYDHYLTRELIPDEEGYREQGQPFRAQGSCAVIIHSEVESRPDPDGIAELADYLSAQGVKHLLVFVNHYMTSAAELDGKELYNCFPEFSAGVAGSRIDCIPLHLEDVGKSVLLPQVVYLLFREDLRWLDDEVNKRIESGGYRLMSPEEYFDV